MPESFVVFAYFPKWRRRDPFSFPRLHCDNQMYGEGWVGEGVFWAESENHIPPKWTEWDAAASLPRGIF